MSYSKKTLWKSIVKRTKDKIHGSHTFTVLNILVEELTNELLSGKEIDIGNFGTFKTKNNNGRSHYNVVLEKNVISKGKKTIKFILNKTIKNLLK